MKSTKSFHDARTAFRTNIELLLSKFNYTASMLSLRLNVTSSTGRSIVSAEDITYWLDGLKMPSLYEMYKLATFFNVSIDALLSPDFVVIDATGKSFAKQTTKSPKINTTINTQTEETTKMAKTTASQNTKKMRALIETRTTSQDYNMLLAYRILSSEMPLKDIAEKVQVSTRSLRDYMYYNSASLDPVIAKRLASVLKTNTTNLGLKLDKTTMRYVAA